MCRSKLLQSLVRHPLPLAGGATSPGALAVAVETMKTNRRLIPGSRFLRRRRARVIQRPALPPSRPRRSKRDPGSPKEQEQDSWQDFADSFVAAGLVPARESLEEPLIAAETKEGGVVLLLPQGQVNSAGAWLS